MVDLLRRPCGWGLTGLGEVFPAAMEDMEDMGVGSRTSSGKTTHGTGACKLTL